MNDYVYYNEQRDELGILFPNSYGIGMGTMRVENGIIDFIDWGCQNAGWIFICEL